MTSDQKPTGIEHPYREAQRGTEEYLDLIREYLEPDIEHLASIGKFDKAIQGRFARLVASGRLDGDIKRQISRASRRTNHRLLRWSVPFALGAAVAALSFTVGFRTRGPSSEIDPNRTGSDLVVEHDTQAGDQAAVTGGEEESSYFLTTPGAVIALYDEKYPGDPAWFSGILSSLRAQASPDLGNEIDRWLSGEAFDTTRVRTGMALWVGAENGWIVTLDGLYESGCSGANCPNVRRAWVAILDIDNSDLVPALPSGAAWSVPADAMAPFEKYLIVRRILGTSPNG